MKMSIAILLLAACTREVKSEKRAEATDNARIVAADEVHEVDLTDNTAVVESEKHETRGPTTTDIDISTAAIPAAEGRPARPARVVHIHRVSGSVVAAEDTHMQAAEVVKVQKDEEVKVQKDEQKTAKTTEDMEVKTTSGPGWRVYGFLLILGLAGLSLGYWYLKFIAKVVWL